MRTPVRINFPSSELSEQDMKRILFGTPDPENNNNPVMSTMLYQVCNGDQVKFEEAIRVVQLFIQFTNRYMLKA